MSELSAITLKARVWGERPELVTALQNTGIFAHQVKGAVIVKLPSLRFQEMKANGKPLVSPFSLSPVMGVSPTKKLIPEAIRGLKFQLVAEATENGGGMSNTGFAQIVCGTGGQKLKPYRIVTKGHLANGEHAFFALHEPFVAIEYAWNRSGFKMKAFHYEILRQGFEVELVKTELDLVELEREHPLFMIAFEASRLKGHAYNCRSVVYAETGRPAFPQPARPPFGPK